MRRSPKTEADDELREWERLAEEAWRRGSDEAASGRLGQATRWLDRASRLAASDQTVKLTLAMVCLARKDARALTLFQEIAARHDVREVWLGLAAARRLTGDHAGAAAALGEALARAALAPDCASVADTIARAARAPGWCGVSGDGRLRSALSDTRAATPEIMLDGTRVRVPRSACPAALDLPRGWRAARTLRVELAGQPLIGSPIDLRAIRRLEGFVEAHEGGLRGWAWHPGDPDRDPTLTILSRNGNRHRFTARDSELEGGKGAVLARPRAFHITDVVIAGLSSPLRVFGADGRDLLGSPLEPDAWRRLAAEAARSLARLFPAGRPRRIADQGRAAPMMPAAIPADTPRPTTATGAVMRRRGIDVVIPVHSGADETLACLASVFAHTCSEARIVVVDDCTPEPRLAQALDDLASKRRIRLIRHASNRGFPASANAGLRASQGRDVVLLNSDTLVPPLWLERLREAAYSAREIGTVSPLSNEATILSYPDAKGGNAAPDLAGTIRTARLAHKANAGVLVDVPTTVGFCMYIRGDCLNAVGLLREDVFAQGYGEENDFCMRARHLGWRHVAAAGAFVTHASGRSFGSARSHLVARNSVLLERPHPGYVQLVQDFIAADPLAEARRSLDLQRWSQTRRPRRPAVVLITHNVGGGVERAVAAQCARLRAEGSRPIVLRPGSREDAKGVAVDAAGKSGSPICASRCQANSPPCSGSSSPSGRRAS